MLILQKPVRNFTNERSLKNTKMFRTGTSCAELCHEGQNSGRKMACQEVLKLEQAGPVWLKGSVNINRAILN